MAITKKYDYIFFSPHLDDAILSCGNLIAQIAQQKKRILIVTIFTIENKFLKKNSKDSKIYLKTTKQKTFQKLFEKKRKHDIRACKILKADFQHLKYIDAALRSAEINHQQKLIYPNFKLIFSGKISAYDKKLVDQIEENIKQIISTFANSQTKIYAPLGIGNHVDHLIVQSLIKKLKNKSFFWEDVPYRHNIFNKYKKIIKLSKKIKKIKQQSSDLLKFAQLKKRAISCYQTEIKGLFDSGYYPIDNLIENYYQID